MKRVQTAMTKKQFLAFCSKHNISADSEVTVGKRHWMDYFGADCIKVGGVTVQAVNRRWEVEAGEHNNRVNQVKATYQRWLKGLDK